MQEYEVSPEGRRERKKRETLLALKAAALDLISERGFNNVTVEDIANAVDVSVRTFFNYFSSKEAALVGESPETVASLQEQLLELPADVPPVEALRTVLMGRVGTMDAEGHDHGAWLRRFSAVRSQPEVMLAYSKHLATIERALADALVKRLGGDERLRGYASLVTACTLSAVKVAGSVWASQGGACPMREVTEAALDLLARGFPIDQSALDEGAVPEALNYLAGPCGTAYQPAPEVRTA